MDQYMKKNEECEKASTKAECGTGNYKECLWQETPDDEGGEDSCEFNGEYIWKLIVGDVDGDHLISIMNSCRAQSSATTVDWWESAPPKKYFLCFPSFILIHYLLFASVLIITKVP